MRWDGQYHDAVDVRMGVVRETAPRYQTGWDKVPCGDPGDLLSAPSSGPSAAPGKPPPPDPFADLDSLLELEDEIRSLSVQIHAATHRLLVLIAEFDRRRGWEVGGHRSCADWLSYRTGIDKGAARERVRAAKALEDLPQTSEAMSRGELSFSQVRALTRVATPDDESELLEFARENSASRLERLVRGWKGRGPESETERDERLHRSRHLSVFPDEDGMYVVKGVLPAELGVLLMRALEAAGDVLFREEGRRTPAALDPEGSRAAAVRRRADALGLLAERALAAGFTAQDGAPVSGTRPERYQVVLHVEEGTLRSADTGHHGRTEPAHGSSSTPPSRLRRVSAETPPGEGPVELRTVAAGPGESWVAGLDATRLRAGGSAAIEARVAGLGAADSRAGGSGSGQPGAGEPRTAEPRAAEPGPAKPGSAEPASGELAGAGSGAREAGAARSSAGSPDSARSGAAESGTAETSPGRLNSSHLEDGTRVSLETSRRLCCDAAVVRVQEAPDGSVLGVGRRTRTVPPALRRALDIRDRGCRFPGCTSRFTDAHHVIHWADGGETSLTNCLLLCPHHHRLVHEGRWKIHWLGKARPLFVDPRGQQHFDGGWKPPVLGDAKEADDKRAGRRGENGLSD